MNDIPLTSDPIGPAAADFLPHGPSTSGATGLITRAKERWRHKPSLFVVLALASVAVGGASVAAARWLKSPVWLAVAEFAALLLVLGLHAAMATAAAYRVNLWQSLGRGFARLPDLAWTFFETLVASMLPLALAVVPGVLMLSRLGLILPSVVADNRDGSAALVRCYDLTRRATMPLGRRWLAAIVALVGVLPALTFAFYAAAPERLAAFTLVGWLAVAAWWLVLGFALSLSAIVLELVFEDAAEAYAAAWAPDPRRQNRYRRLAIVGCALVAVLAVAWSGSLGDLMRTLKTMPNPLAPTKPPAATTAEPTAQDRDWERYRHLDMLRIASASFKHEHDRYPVKLAELVPQYLKELPVDPQTAAPYPYQLTVDGYLITVNMEVGVLALSAGQHKMSPDGFDRPSDTGDARMPTPPSPTGTAPAPKPGETKPKNPLPPVGNGQPTGDSDNDGLSDETEIALGTDPFKADTDGDGLSDYVEFQITKTDPLKADTDGDGFSDGDEVNQGFDPKSVGGRLPDSDNDGLSDVAEELRGTNPHDPDSDMDGLADGDEVNVYGTDPLKADTDGDGVSDATEILRGTDPLGAGTLSKEQKATMDARAAKIGLHQPTLKTLGK